MKNGSTVILLTLLAAGLVWFVGNNKPAPLVVSAPAPGAGDLSASGARQAGHAKIQPEVPPPDTEMEPEPEPELPAAVAPLPTPRRSAAAEESPAGPGVATSDTSLTPTTVIENMRSALRQYHARFRENPVGDNAEITTMLTGGNAKQAVFIQTEDGLRVNSQGQLIDNWGTPFFFHSLSRNGMEIRSAGPDRRMWTTDDLASK